MMNLASSIIKKLLPVLRNDAFYEGMELVAAYESDIKPYPVEHPIIALAVDSQTVGERLVDIAADGTQTRSKRREVEVVYKVSIFVPYENGAQSAYRIADYLHGYLLFRTELSIVGSKYADCNYVRDCGALVLHTTFTQRVICDS